MRYHFRNPKQRAAAQLKAKNLARKLTADHRRPYAYRFDGRRSYIVFKCYMPEHRLIRYRERLERKNDVRI